MDILHAGSGRGSNTTAAVSVLGVAPNMRNVRISNSAFHGAEVLNTDSPVVLTNCELEGNAGYGIVINSTYGQVLQKISIYLMHLFFMDLYINIHVPLYYPCISDRISPYCSNESLQYIETQFKAIFLYCRSSWKIVLSMAMVQMAFAI